QVGQRGHREPIGFDEEAGNADPAFGRVPRDRRHGGGLDRNEDAAVLEDVQRLGRIVAADDLQDDIEVADDVGEVGGGVVDDLVGAEGAYEGGVRGRCQRNDICTARLGHLHREM